MVWKCSERVIQGFLKNFDGRSKLCKKFQEWYSLLAFHLFIAFNLTRVSTIFLVLFYGFSVISLEHSDTDNNKQKVTVTIYYLIIFFIFLENVPITPDNIKQLVLYCFTTFSIFLSVSSYVMFLYCLISNRVQSQV